MSSTARAPMPYGARMAAVIALMVEQCNRTGDWPDPLAVARAFGITEEYAAQLRRRAIKHITGHDPAPLPRGGPATDAVIARRNCITDDDLAARYAGRRYQDHPDALKPEPIFRRLRPVRVLEGASGWQF